MSHYPLVKFVDGPSVGATVRLDLNDGAASASRRVEADFDLGVPTLEGDPDAVGQVFGFRSPRFTVQVKGTKANALAFVSALSKELLRRTNWVMFQPSAATQPVWFKVYRTGYEPLSLKQMFGNSTTGGAAPAGFPDVWRVEVPLVAEAFAYGARVVIPTVQVVQSPADLAGPTRIAMKAVLPAIKGDAPTGLRVTITPAAGSIAAADASSWLVGCSCGEANMSAPVADIGTGDGFTAGAGTGTGVPDAAYFNGSYRLVTVGAGANILERLSGALPSAPIGRYKVLLRVEADAPAATAKPYMFYVGYPDATLGPTWVNKIRQTVGSVTVGSAQTYQGWVDLGELTLPFGSTIPTDVPYPSLGSAISIAIGTADGSTGAVRIDAIKLIPVDGPSVRRAAVLKATWSAGQTSLANGISGNFDADSSFFWSTNGAILLPRSPSMQGSFPVADPAAPQNLLTIMAMFRGHNIAGPWITSLNAQCAVDVSYYPRFLHVGDGT